MKKKYFTMAVAACFMLATVCACNNGKSSKERIDDDMEEVEGEDEEDAEDEDDAVESEEAENKDAEIRAFIIDMYENGRYMDYEYLRKYCTKNLLTYLKEQYEYDGEGYAGWLFRTGSQDGKPGCEGVSDAVNEISKRPDGWWRYEFTDGGWKGINEVKVIVEDGKLKFDGVRTFYDEAQEQYEASFEEE